MNNLFSRHLSCYSKLTIKFVAMSKFHNDISPLALCNIYQHQYENSDTVFSIVTNLLCIGSTSRIR